MEFEIHKTSDFLGDAFPIAGAVKKTVPNWDNRNCTEEYFNASPIMSKNGKWREKGENHQVTPGGIKRQIGTEEKWFIEIKSLEELIALIGTAGNPFIIDEDTIEIYDDYRE